MSGDLESGLCSICKKPKILQRKYYHFDIKCECCGGDTHFEIVWHCESCIPIVPKYTRALLKTSDLTPVSDKDPKNGIG